MCLPKVPQNAVLSADGKSSIAGFHGGPMQRFNVLDDTRSTFLELYIDDLLLLGIDQMYMGHLRLDCE